MNRHVCYTLTIFFQPKRFYGFDKGSSGIKIASANSKTFGYDYNNMLVRAYITQGANEREITNTYDSGGSVRIKKTDNGAVRYYAYNGGKMLCEYGANGTMKKNYVYALGKCIATIDSAGNKTFNSHDAQGSVKLITNASGIVVKSYSYYPFGDSLSFSGTAQNELRYTEQRYVDGIEAYDYNARYYDQKLGRFYGMDPMFSPVISPYAYCANDPINFTDPTGMARQVAVSWQEFWGTVEAGRAGMICGSWGGAGAMHGSNGYLAKNPDAGAMVRMNNYISDQMFIAARNDYWREVTARYSFKNDKDFIYNKDGTTKQSPMAYIETGTYKYFNVIDLCLKTVNTTEEILSLLNSNNTILDIPIANEMMQTVRDLYYNSDYKQSRQDNREYQRSEENSALGKALVWVIDWFKRRW